VFKCSEVKKDEEKEFLLKSKIASTVNSKQGSKVNSRDASKVISRKSRLTNKQVISLTGSNLTVKGQGVKGKDIDGKEVTILNFNDKEMLVKYPLINISPIPPRTFNVRLIIWNAEDVPAMDLGGTSDS